MSHFLPVCAVLGAVLLAQPQSTENMPTEEAADVKIRKNGEPLPCKLVVTGRQIEVRPKYSATLGWDAGSEFADTTFTFVPPQGASQIDFDAALDPAN